MMFKALILQNLYGLSDDPLEYQIEDRRSFKRFLELSHHQRAPDAKTIWRYEEKLSRLKLSKSLFDKFSVQLGRKGQRVDAGIIPCPIQGNNREENKLIKKGEIPTDWKENKRRQKDIDARWTKKNGKT